MSAKTQCADHYHCRSWWKITVNVDYLLGALSDPGTVCAKGVCDAHRMACAGPDKITCVDPCPSCGERWVESEHDVDARKVGHGG
jgi:hypothetical protein